jgi:hypothetical protein
MARARNIKPGFFQNDDLGDLDPIARLLFIGMWTIADFKGCIEYRPKRIKAQLLPYDDCDIEQLASNLDLSGFISIYSVQGQRYIKVINFDRHQNPHKNERDSGSDIPDITEKDNEIKDLTDFRINRDKNGTTPADSLILIPSSLIPHPDSLIADSGLPKKTIVEQKPLDVIAEVFGYWQKVMDSKKSVLDKNRIKLIEKALKLYTPADICKAIRGCSKSPYNMGQNEQKTKYNGLGLILRNAEKIDRFIQLDTGQAISATETLEQRNARIIAEVMADVRHDDENTIEMEC